MKNKNIHILPTDKPSNLLFEKISNRYYTNSRRKENSKNVQNQNIYITSDEEIKEGDWLFDLDIKRIVKADNSKVLTSQATGCWYYKKIILTTDQDLIKDGVQAITDEFLKWFVKNPSCESVDVNGISDVALGGFTDVCYKIIIPKTTQEIIDEDFAGGLTMGQIQSEVEPTSCACGANTSCQCEEPKEKTFEEILSKMTLVNPKHLRMTSNGHGEFPDGYMLTEDGVKYIVKQLKNK